MNEEIKWVHPVISPTGLGMRSDAAGLGHHGAPRGGRLHNGMDFLCVPGQVVISPIEGNCMRYSYPYKDLSYNGVRIEGSQLTVVLWYVTPNFEPSEVVKGIVHQGDEIGIAQDVSKKYGDIGMLPHVHLRIEKCDPRLLMDPEILKHWEEVGAD